MACQRPGPVDPCSRPPAVVQTTKPALSLAPQNYQAYGLILQSPLPLPCPLAPGSDRPDVLLHAGSTTRFARARVEHPPADDTRTWFRFHRLADGSAYLKWTGLFEFVISPDGREILFHRQKTAAPESFSVYLLSQVLSFSLLSFGTEPLHGTAVVVGGEALVLLGDCGYGKSTLGAALLARGLPILTDDLVALEKSDVGWMVRSGIPRIKLFPAVARRLLGSDLGGTPMNGGTSKLVLPLGPGQAVSRSVPLRALYVLSPPGEHRSVKGRPVQIERLSGREAFLEVIRAAFNLMALESSRMASQFAFARRLILAVPVRRLTYPRDFSRLSTVCDALLADLAALSLKDPGASTAGTATAQWNGDHTASSQMTRS